MVIKQTKRTGERIADFTVRLSKPEQSKYNFVEQVFSVDTCLRNGYEGVMYLGATKENWKAKEEDRIRVGYIVKVGKEEGKWFVSLRITDILHQGTSVDLPFREFTYYRVRKNGLRTCLKSFLKELIKGGYLKIPEKPKENLKNFEITHLQSHDYLI